MLNYCSSCHNIRGIVEYESRQIKFKRNSKAENSKLRITVQLVLSFTAKMLTTILYFSMKTVYLAVLWILL